MREILFRGKRIDNGELVEGFYHQNLCGFNEIVAKNKDKEFSIITYQVISETVGQFTGLTDNNGKNIFEGDILKVGYFRRYYTGKVVYNEKTCGFEFWYKSVVGAYGEKALHKMNFAQFDDLEVIGNIYDDPELLKELQE